MLKLALGIVLAVAAFAGVILLGNLSRPPTYQVAVVVAEVAPFSPLSPDQVQIDAQSLSAAVAGKYVLADEWEAMLAAGPVVAVEQLYPGQPLMREVLATGENALRVRRLSVALTDPELVIINVPLDPQQVPAVYGGDAVALYFSAGQIQARTLVSDVVSPAEAPSAGPPLPAGPVMAARTEAVTQTVELELPLTKRLTEGLVYRLNREQQENPNYGAPGMEQEPRYVEGQVVSMDVVVHQDAAEWVAFALAHGKVQVGVLPAVAIPQLQGGTLPSSPGATWSDLEALFFAQRFQGE
jgi:hypothetical protein